MPDLSHDPNNPIPVTLVGGGETFRNFEEKVDELARGLQAITDQLSGKPQLGTPPPASYSRPPSPADPAEVGAGQFASRPPGAPVFVPPQSSDRFKGWMGRVDPSIVQQAISMPRYGEFTFQDTMRMMENALGSTAWGQGKVANALGGVTLPGQFTAGTSGGASQAGAFRNTAGFLAGNVFQPITQYSPYVARAYQMTGMPSPSALGQQGAAAGLPGGSQVSLGPLSFQLPGANLFTSAEAAFGNIIQGAGTAGITGPQIQGISDAMNAIGWGPGQPEYDAIKNALISAGTIGNQTEGEMPDKALQASMAESAFRYGTTSINDFVNIMRQIPDAARSAHLGVNEYTQELISSGQALQQSGLTFSKGVAASQNFSTATGLPPAVGTALMSNPFIQANLQATTGLLPQSLGLAFQNTGLFMDSALKTIHQIKGTFATSINPAGSNIFNKYGFASHISAQSQEDSLAANALGMSPDEYKQFVARAKRFSVRSNINQGLRLFDSEIRNNRETDPNWRRDQFHGLGAFGGPGRISWPELRKMMEDPHSGLNQSQMQHFHDEFAKTPLQAIKDIQKAMDKSSSTGKTGKNANVSITISTTPQFKRWFTAHRVDTPADQKRKGQLANNPRATDNNPPDPAPPGSVLGNLADLGKKFLGE